MRCTWRNLHTVICKVGSGWSVPPSRGDPWSLNPFAPINRNVQITTQPLLHSVSSLSISLSVSLPVTVSTKDSCIRYRGKSRSLLLSLGRSPVSGGKITFYWGRGRGGERIAVLFLISFSRCTNDTSEKWNIFSFRDNSLFYFIALLLQTWSKIL